jgi:hypothetical protein
MAATPEWLTRHGGEVRPGKDTPSWAVYLEGEPQYILLAVPVAGKFGCRISQTVNGKRLDGADTWANAEQALAGGLEVLRQKLGW